jgi:glycosyltransferase involved in cell wall biosynthesis
MKIACILNECDDTTIPIENFLALDPNMFDRVLIVFNLTNSEIMDFLRRNGSDLDVKVYGLKGIGIFNKLLSIRAILQHEKPEVLHGHHTMSSIIGSILALFFANIKSVFTVHSYFSSYKFRNKVVFLLIYFLSDRLVANSENTKSSVPSIVRRSKIVVIYNGVSTERLDASSVNALQGSFVLGTISRLVAQKDHETLVRAFGIFLAYEGAPIDSKLYIIGGGPLEKKLKSLVHDLNLSGNVVFTGALPRGEAYGYLKAFDVFVVSSRFEGFCNAMVEAMFSGTPVIASHVQPLPEVLGQQNGMFFEVGDSEALARRLLEFYRNPNIAVKRSKAALRLANATYSLEICARSHGSLYLEIANG